MSLNVSPARRALAVALGAGAVATMFAAMFSAAPVALADPPNCTAADLAAVAAGVSAGTSAYLFTHPDVNAFMTGLKGQPRDQVRAQVMAYLDANPQTKAEIQAVRQPLTDLRVRCGADDVSMP